MSRLTSFAISIPFLLLLYSSSLFADGDGAITIRGVEGRGKDEQTALNNAFRNAIRKAIGGYVVSSFSTDGETVDKKVFDNCDAVVSKYDVVDREENDGKVTLVIDAEIVRNEMMKYIQKNASTEVGEGELANLLAKRNAVNNAVKSLELIFMNWRENVYRVEKYGDLSIADDDDAEGETVKISVPFILTFNWQAYEIFMAKVRNVLSRIAIDKTGGEWDPTWRDGHRSDSLSESLTDFYIKAGLARKDRNDNIHYDGNSNNYGGVLLFSHSGNGCVRWEFFIVPQQIKKALGSLLEAKAEIRFSLTGKGGGTIASRSIAGEVCSFGWDYFHIASFIYGSLGSDDHSDSYNVVLLSDKIRTEFRHNWSWHDEWAEKRLFRATIPVPLNAASRVASCMISVQPMSDEGLRGDRDGDITSQTIQDAEWDRVDGKPRQKVTPPTSKHMPKQNAAPPTGRVSSESHTPSGTIAANAVHSSAMAISTKDMELKSRVDELVNASPDSSTAAKWFALSGEAESKDLKQEMLKASGAALVYAKKGDVYRTRVRSLINDIEAFEQAFFANCPSCCGKKTTISPCVSCSGGGICKYANCRGGRHLVRQIQGDKWELCHDCHGTGRCQKCGGTGRVQSKCASCNGKGRVLDVNSIARAYRNTVEIITMAFRKEDDDR